MSSSKKFFKEIESTSENYDTLSRGKKYCFSDSYACYRPLTVPMKLSCLNPALVPEMSEEEREGYPVMSGPVGVPLTWCSLHLQTLVGNPRQRDQII